MKKDTNNRRYNGWKYKVEIICSDKSWFPKKETLEYFETYEEAVEFVKEYNNSNNKESAAGAIQSWYTYASDPVEVQNEV